MKNRSALAAIAILILSAPYAASGQTQGPVVKDPNPKPVVYPDISCRPALYFGGEFPDFGGVYPGKTVNGQAFAKIADLPTMLKGARYVTAGQTITLTKADILWEENANGKEYAVNLGFYLFLKTPTGAPAIGSFVNRIRIGSKVIAQPTFTPAPGQEIKAVHMQVYLPVGESTLTLSIDDDKQVKESSETNNVYSFKVIVKP